MAHNALFARPHCLDRPPHLEGGKGQHNLHRDVLAAAEGPAHITVTHDHLVLVDPQCVRNFVALFMHPLPRADDFEAAIGQHMRQTRLGLQVGVLLGVRVIGCLDHHVGLRKARCDVAIADVVLEQQVGVEGACAVGEAEFVGVQDGRTRREGGLCAGDHLQRFVIDLDQFCGGLGLERRLSHHQRDVVRLPAHDLGLARAAGATEHRLVGHDQPILVHGHISRGEDGEHAGCTARRFSVDGQHARVRHAREDNLEPCLVGQVNVACVLGVARHLGQSVKAGGTAANCTHRTLITSSGVEARAGE